MFQSWVYIPLNYLSRVTNKALFKHSKGIQFLWTFFNVRAFPSPFFWFIFHQFSNTIQYYLVIICPVVMLPYPLHWWFPQLRYSPISRAITIHSAREHRRRESIAVVICFNLNDTIFIRFENLLTAFESVNAIVLQ